MFGGRWEQDGSYWRLIWTEDTIRDYYLNNVLIHEIGHHFGFSDAEMDRIEREE